MTSESKVSDERIINAIAVGLRVRRADGSPFLPRNQAAFVLMALREHGYDVVPTESPNATNDRSSRS